MSKASLWNVDWDKVIEERFGVDAETLSQYADAHKAGKALIVPCKVGQKLYFLTTRVKFFVEETTCNDISVVNRNGNPCVKVIALCTNLNYKRELMEFYPEDFDVRIFTNLDKCLEKLKERKAKIQENLSRNQAI